MNGELTFDLADSLTPETEGDRMPLKTQLGVNMGSYREFRPGRWRIAFYHEGERFDVYSNNDGEPLETERQCAKTLAHIEELIKRKEFDPAAWRKDKPFLFERAVETWMKLKPVSDETLESRDRIVKKFLLPFFMGKDITSDDTINKGKQAGKQTPIKMNDCIQNASKKDRSQR